MKILAVDTSTMTGSVALLEDDFVLAEWLLQSAQTHNRRLLNTVDALLQEIQWSVDELDGFAVTMGPGSFTGVRIGLTTVKTLAWIKKKPLAAIPTLDALAAPLSPASHPVCALLNAGKKEVYSAVYQGDGRGAMRRIEPYRVSAPQEVASRITSPTLFCGDGWLAYKDTFLDQLGDRAIEAPAPLHVIRAGFVGALAWTRFRSGEAQDPLTVTPLYIRPSEAEINYPHLAGPRL